MALSDLEEVAKRLRDLHERLEVETGRNWTDQEIAQAADIPYRTFQSWIGAKNENTNGRGYAKLATFYRRKLKDKTITKRWLVFGGEERKAPDVIGALDGDVAEGDLKLVLANQQGILDSLTKLATAVKRLEARFPADPQRPSRRSATRG